MEHSPKSSSELEDSITSRSNSSMNYDSSPNVTPAVNHDNNPKLDRKDFPNSIQKTMSEKKSAVTPKNLRFRMISPSNSNASTSSFDAPVIVKPISQPTPITFKNPQSSELARKRSSIANVGGDDTSSGEFRHITIGNPTGVEIILGGDRDLGDRSASSSTFESTSSTSTAASGIVSLPVNKEDRNGTTVVLPLKGRTHCNAMIGAERPHEGPDYFQFMYPPNKRAVGVVIPFFNEEERELKRTLESLETQSKLIFKLKNLGLHVLLIMDGWSKAADSMRDYVKMMFPPANSSLPWWTALDDKTQQDTVETFFLQRIVPYGKKKSSKCAALGEVPITREGEPGNAGKQKKLTITMIIKRDNRRKHNSHEWFFGRGGFAEFYKHELLFATDCGTLFEKDCLLSLISYMESNPTVSVSTGRQRVMTKAQQGSDEHLFSLATMYRLAQCYDYESSFACFMGAFALFGFLPVIPGPCGLYRASDMLGAPRDWYFDVVNTDPDKSGMVLGNLRIAEDRVLSYAAVLKTAEPRRMALIPEATFYFEAETSLEKFLLQRRRWTNGTVAGYIYMCLQFPQLLFNANMNPIRKICVYFLLICQVLVYAVVAVSPAIFLVSLHSTFRSIFPLPNFPQTYPEIAWYLCIALYVGMVIVHSKAKFRAWMFYTLLIVAWIVIIGAFWTFGRYVYLHGIHFGGTEDFQWLSILIVICVTGLPLVIAFLHSLKSFAFMLISVIPYYLMLPMMVAWFSAYAFARTWDLTWGNRPASAEHTSHGGSAANKVNIEKELKAKAMTVAVFVVIANLVFILVVEQIQHETFAILILASFIFTFAVLQMILSCIYFLLYYDPRRIIETVWRIATYPFRKPQVTYEEEESSDEEEEEFIENKAPSTPEIKQSKSTSSVHIGKSSSLAQGFGSIHKTKSDLFIPSRVQSTYDIHKTKSKSVLSRANSKAAISRANSKIALSANVNNNSETEHLTEIKPSRSKTVININDNGEELPETDLAEVVMEERHSPRGSPRSHGPVKRTPSYASAV